MFNFRFKYFHQKIIIFIAEAKFLVFANKQDLPNAINCAELIKVLELHENSGQQWHVQPSNAVTGEGIAEGLEWLHPAILKD
ncbi:hypothetical protein OESDEN_14447 [Oesophagostomum dentatum]|uniref:ADP-ribosylation factor family protein n=1 Tax=Oesophagostomum dentatum TaxID=61180 RepID=A0A0B1SKF4_OESDE|nr:hypothetical protein OESDEN_14447 [Oesophagostomum dentatum]